MNLRIILLLTIIFIVTKTEAQTLDTEQNYMLDKFKKGEITQQEFNGFLTEWKTFLKNYGGYPTLPYDSINKQICFEYVKKFTLSKQIIYNRTLEWISMNYGAGLDVINYSNTEDGKIILTASSIIMHERERNLFNWFKNSFKITTQKYIFTAKDDKLKILVTNIKYEFINPEALILQKYNYPLFTQVPINWLYPIVKNDRERWTECLDILNQTDKEINDIVNRLSKYINDYTIDKNF